MSPWVAVIESRPGIFGRLPQRERRDWAAVVARHTRDDWPPPGWLARTMEVAGDPAPYRVSEGRVSVAA